MGTRQTFTRERAPVETRVAPSIAKRSAPVAAGPVQKLASRLGNAGMSRHLAMSSLRVSSPQEPAEREAVSTAARVMQMTSAPAASLSRVEPVPTGVSRHPQACSCSDCACRQTAYRKEAGPEHTSPQVTSAIHSSMAGGSPLPGHVRGFMEPRFGADFSDVRIHTGDQAAQLSADLGAHAFTVGNHVYFGRNQYQPDSASGKQLIAHELTHTIQQGGSAQRTATVQRDEDKRSWWERLTDWSSDFAWDMVRKVAPDSEPILRGGPSGILTWVGSKISTAIENMFSTLMAPIRAVSGVGAQLAAFFGPILTVFQTAIGKIAKNDCSPLREAADQIEKTALKIITPIVEFIQPIVTKVKGFLNDVWDKVGSPIWDLIKDYAKTQWDALMWLVDKIKAYYVWIWEKTAWVRAIAAKAWNWVKNQLGIGEGPEGQDGLLQWVQGKVEAGWQALSAKLAPFKKQLTTIVTVVGGALLLFSPAGPVLAVAAAVAGIIQGARWIAAHWGKGDMVVQARQYLQQNLIPVLLSGIHRLSAAVTAMAHQLVGTLTSIGSHLTQLASSLGGGILSLAASAVEWLAEQATALANWATTQLESLAHWVEGSVDALAGFLNKILALLKRLGGVILDIYGLPVMLAEKVWDWIPACIRDPIVDFIVPIILRQIELFSELGKDAKAWQQTKKDVMNLIHLVFKDHDLVGAVKAAFMLVLRIFNTPAELIVSVFHKALAAWDTVSKAPIVFIKTTVRAIGHGFHLLKQNWKTHLAYGLEGWLFGELADRNIHPPSSWKEPKQLFLFAMDVLGLSVNHIYELLEKRFDPIKVRAFRQRMGQVAAVLDWIDKSIDVTKSPKENAQGIWNQAKEFGKTILTGIAEWVTAQILVELGEMAAAAAASAGLSEVLDAVRRIYRVLVSVKRYLSKILHMVEQGLDKVLDLAAGKVESVGETFEKIMHMGMPVVIGFLAAQVGLGGIAEEIKSIVDDLRETVDKAILWFIDKIKSGIDAVINFLSAGLQKLKDWWTKEVPLTGGTEKHTLKFDGSDESAMLMVFSDPKPVGEYVKAFVTAPGSAAKIKESERLEKEIRKTKDQIVTAKKANNQGNVAALTATLDNLMDQLGQVLISMMIEGSRDGSEASPLLIDYPKRSPSAYQDIYIGPKIGVGERVNQEWLRGIFGSKPEDAKTRLAKKLAEEKPELTSKPSFNDWKGEIKKYSPMVEGQPIDGKSVGLRSDLASIGERRVLVYDEKGSTGGGGKINDVFRPFGFVPKIDGGEGLDGDHVLERQLGGPDDLINLWPLSASENRSSGATVKSIMVTYKGKKENQPREWNVHDARVDRGEPLYLLVRSVK